MQSGKVRRGRGGGQYTLHEALLLPATGAQSLPGALGDSEEHTSKWTHQRVGVLACLSASSLPSEVEGFC